MKQEKYLQIQTEHQKDAKLKHIKQDAILFQFGYTTITFDELNNIRK